MRVGFFVTARLKSTRLPKKVMLELAGKPAIVHMLDRIKQAKRIDTIVICTSTNPQDEPLAQIAAQERVGCYRGSEEDVLMRLLEAAHAYHVDYIVNLTADCPLVDPMHIDAVVEAYRTTQADLITTNRLPPGQGSWGIALEALRKVCEMKEETNTEVWGRYFTASGAFRVYDLEVDPAQEHPTLKTSLDYPEDYAFLRRLVDELYVPGEAFSLNDVLRLVKEKPELLAMNASCKSRGLEHVARTAPPARLRPQKSCRE